VLSGIKTGFEILQLLAKWRAGPEAVKYQFTPVELLVIELQATGLPGQTLRQRDLCWAQTASQKAYTFN
jgi:hypothetical protein